MDKAFIGSCRIGYGRIGVQRPDWDRLLAKFKNVSAKSLGGKTPCIQGSAKQGMTRHHVKVPLFDELMEKVKKSG